MFYGQDDPRRAYLGKRGYYYMTTVNNNYGPSRIVCLNCTAYVRTKHCYTQVGRGTHEGTMRTRFCPCCGAEFTHLVEPDDKSNQMKLVVDA